MALDLERFAFSASLEEEEAILSPQNMPDEEVVEELLSEKLMNGFMLLDFPCPKCMIPLVKQPAPFNLQEECEKADSEPSTPRIVTQLSMEDVPKPVRGIPYCVSCESYMVTNEQEAQLLDILKTRDNCSVAETYNSLDTRALNELNASGVDDKTRASSHGGWLSRKDSKDTNVSGILFKNTWSRWKRDDSSNISVKSDCLGKKLSKKLLGMVASQDQGVEMKLEGRDDNSSAAFWREVEKTTEGREPPSTPRWILSRPSVQKEFGIEEEGEVGEVLNRDEIEETLTDLGVLSKEDCFVDRVEIHDESAGEIEVQDPKQNKHNAEDDEKWGHELLKIAKKNTAETEPANTFEEADKPSDEETEEADEDQLEKNEVEMLMNMASSVSGEVSAALDKIEKTALDIQSKQYKGDSNEEVPRDLLVEEKESSNEEENDGLELEYKSWRQDSFSSAREASLSSGKSASSRDDDAMEEYTVR